MTDKSIEPIVCTFKIDAPSESRPQFQMDDHICERPACSAPDYQLTFRDGSWIKGKLNWMLDAEQSSFITSSNV
jgi:hypothetical protein